MAASAVTQGLGIYSSTHPRIAGFVQLGVSTMAMHFTTSTERTACGRLINKATATSAHEEVTCKTCRNTEAFCAAAASNPESPNPKATAKPTGVVYRRRLAGVAFQEWSHRLNNTDRLPRGKFFTGHRPNHQRGRQRSSTAAGR
jgi:hypothetical protein